jgi:hypothetical protein
VLRCGHGEETNDDDRLNPADSAYGVLLRIISSNQFLNDIGLMSSNSSTSFVESFNSLAIIYRPKKKF